MKSRDLDDIDISTSDIGTNPIAETFSPFDLEDNLIPPGDEFPFTQQEEMDVLMDLSDLSDPQLFSSSMEISDSNDPKLSSSSNSIFNSSDSQLSTSSILEDSSSFELLSPVALQPPVTTTDSNDTQSSTSSMSIFDSGTSPLPTSSMPEDSSLLEPLSPVALQPQMDSKENFEIKLSNTPEFYSSLEELDAFRVFFKDATKEEYKIFITLTKPNIEKNTARECKSAKTYISKFSFEKIAQRIISFNKNIDKIVSSWINIPNTITSTRDGDKLHFQLKRRDYAINKALPFLSKYYQLKDESFLNQIKTQYDILFPLKPSSAKKKKSAKNSNKNTKKSVKDKIDLTDLQAILHGLTEEDYNILCLLSTESKIHHNGHHLVVRVHSREKWSTKIKLKALQSITFTGVISLFQKKSNGEISRKSLRKRAFAFIIKYKSYFIKHGWNEDEGDFDINNWWVNKAFSDKISRDEAMADAQKLKNKRLAAKNKSIVQLSQMPLIITDDSLNSSIPISLSDQPFTSQAITVEQQELIEEFSDESFNLSPHLTETSDSTLGQPIDSEQFDISSTDRSYILPFSNPLSPFTPFTILESDKPNELEQSIPYTPLSDVTSSFFASSSSLSSLDPNTSPFSTLDTLVPPETSDTFLSPISFPNISKPTEPSAPIKATKTRKRKEQPTSSKKNNDPKKSKSSSSNKTKKSKTSTPKITNKVDLSEIKTILPGFTEEDYRVLVVISRYSLCINRLDGKSNLNQLRASVAQTWKGDKIKRALDSITPVEVSSLFPKHGRLGRANLKMKAWKFVNKFKDYFVKHGWSEEAGDFKIENWGVDKPFTETTTREAAKQEAEKLRNERIMKLGLNHLLAPISSTSTTQPLISSSTEHSMIPQSLNTLPTLSTEQKQNTYSTFSSICSQTIDSKKSLSNLPASVEKKQATDSIEKTTVLLPRKKTNNKPKRIDPASTIGFKNFELIIKECKNSFEEISPTPEEYRIFSLLSKSNLASINPNRPLMPPNDKNTASIQLLGKRIQSMGTNNFKIHLSEWKKWKKTSMMSETSNTDKNRSWAMLKLAEFANSNNVNSFLEKYHFLDQPDFYSKIENTISKLYLDTNTIKLKLDAKPSLDFTKIQETLPNFEFKDFKVLAKLSKYVTCNLKAALNGGLGDLIVRGTANWGSGKILEALKSITPEAVSSLFPIVTDSNNRPHERLYLKIAAFEFINKFKEYFRNHGWSEEAGDFNPDNWGVTKPFSKIKNTTRESAMLEAKQLRDARIVLKNNIQPLTTDVVSSSSFVPSTTGVLSTLLQSSSLSTIVPIEKTAANVKSNTSNVSYLILDSDSKTTPEKVDDILTRSAYVDSSSSQSSISSNPKINQSITKQRKQPSSTLKSTTSLESKTVTKKYKKIDPESSIGFKNFERIIEECNNHFEGINPTPDEYSIFSILSKSTFNSISVRSMLMTPTNKNTASIQLIGKRIMTMGINNFKTHLSEWKKWEEKSTTDENSTTVANRNLDKQKLANFANSSRVKSFLEKYHFLDQPDFYSKIEYTISMLDATPYLDFSKILVILHNFEFNDFKILAKLSRYVTCNLRATTNEGLGDLIVGGIENWDSDRIVEALKFITPEAVSSLFPIVTYANNPPHERLYLKIAVFEFITKFKEYFKINGWSEEAGDFNPDNWGVTKPFSRLKGTTRESAMQEAKQLRDARIALKNTNPLTDVVSSSSLVPSTTGILSVLSQTTHLPSTAIENTASNPSHSDSKSIEDLSKKTTSMDSPSSQSSVSSNQITQTSYRLSFWKPPTVPQQQKDILADKVNNHLIDLTKD